MSKRSLILVLSISLMHSISYAYNFEVDGIYYNFIDGENGEAVSVTYNGTKSEYNTSRYSDDVIIPEHVTYNDKTYTVTTIGTRAFEFCEYLQSVSLPQSITRIESRAFNCCKRMVPFTLHDGLEYIGESAFCNCDLITKMTIPTSVNYIGRNAFSQATKEIIISDGDVPLSIECAYGTNVIEQIYAGRSLIAIKSTNQSNSPSFPKLIKLTIGSRVKEIYLDFFVGSSELTSLDIQDCTEALKIVGNIQLKARILNMGRDLIIASGLFPSLTELYVGSNVRMIPAGICKSCTNLEMLNIDDGVQIIEKNAFEGCTALKSLTIPASVTEIGNSAFKGCTELVSLTLADGEQTLTIDNTGNRSYSEDQDAFCGCPIDQLYLGRSVVLKGDGVCSPFPKISNVVMGQQVKGIPKYMFIGCNLLTSVQFGDNLETIGENAFQDCTLLSGADIKKCTTIGAEAFKGCSALATLSLPEGLQIIESSAFGQCSKLKSLVIPGSVTEIGSVAFDGCAGLKTIRLADGDDRLTIDNLSWRIFEGCRPDYFYLGRTVSSSEKTNIITNVGVLEIGDKVKSIYPCMFQGCDNMEELTIGGMVSSIGDNAFRASPYLASVYCNGSVPPVCKSNTFYGCPTDARLYVPKGCKTAYTTADYWKDFGSIVETNEDGIGDPASGLKGDVDGDGVVDIADAVRIVNLVVGKIDTLARKMEWNTHDPQ